MVIVGSGISRLTLARDLAHVHIHSIILDERSLAAAIGGGALIGVFPNGGKYLNELGLFDEVLRLAEPIQKSYLWSDNALLCRRSYPQIIAWGSVS